MTCKTCDAQKRWFNIEESAHLKFDAKYCFAAVSPLLRKYRSAVRFIHGTIKRLALSPQAVKQESFACARANFSQMQTFCHDVMGKFAETRVLPSPSVITPKPSLYSVIDVTNVDVE
jgi:hypothetical protein